jgi:hypothetical protein
MALAVAIETGIPWFECLARIALAQAQGASVDRRGVEAQLRGAQAIAERLRSPWLRYAVELAASDAARIAGDKRAMLDGIRTAFRQGQDHGFCQPPGWQPAALADLCVVALNEEIEPDFARALVRKGRLAPTAPPLRVSRWPWPFRILTFGGFQCLRGGSLLELSAKGPGRPMELLKVLVALGSHNVRADQLADALWPNIEADYAYKSFTATLHRLRRLLDDDHALVLRDGRLTLNRELVWVDTWALEQLFDDFDTGLRTAATGIDEARQRRFAEEALALIAVLSCRTNRSSRPTWRAGRGTREAPAFSRSRRARLGGDRLAGDRDRILSAFHRGRRALRATLPPADALLPARWHTAGGTCRLRAVANAPFGSPQNDAVARDAGPLR